MWSRLVFEKGEGSMKNLTWMAGLALWSALSVFAQTGSLTGSVTDPSGQLIPGATVKLTYELNGEERVGVTNTSGDFTFSALAPGAYTVRVESSGFRPAERKGNMVLAAGRLALGTLQLEVGSLTESVTVTAEGANVATTTTAHAAVLDNKQVAMISLRGR